MRIVLLLVSVIIFSFGNAFAAEDTCANLCIENRTAAESACTADLYFGDFSKCMHDAKTTWNGCKGKCS